MPQSNIVQIYHEIIRIVENITPDYLPDIPFREGFDDFNVEESMYGGGPYDGTRRFKLEPGQRAGNGGPVYGNWNGSRLIRLRVPLVLAIRYNVPKGYDGDEDAKKMQLADGVQLAYNLSPVAEKWQLTGDEIPALLNPTGGSVVSRIAGDVNFEIMTFPIIITIDAGDG